MTRWRESEGAIAAWPPLDGSNPFLAIAEALASHVGFSLDVPFGQLDHDAKIVEFFFGNKQRLDFLPQGIRFVDQLLGFLAIVPEIVLRHQNIEFRQALLSVGDVKETSANGRVCRRRSSTDL